MPAHSIRHLLSLMLILAASSLGANSLLFPRPSDCDPSKATCIDQPKKRCEAEHCAVNTQTLAAFQKKNDCESPANCDLKTLFWDAIREKESGNAKCTLENKGCRATTGSPVYGGKSGGNGGVRDPDYIGASGGTTQMLHYNVMMYLGDEATFKNDDACRRDIGKNIAKQARARADKAYAWVNKLFGGQTLDADRKPKNPVVIYNESTKTLEFKAEKIKDHLPKFMAETGMDEAMLKRMAVWGFFRAADAMPLPDKKTDPIKHAEALKKRGEMMDSARQYLAMEDNNKLYVGTLQYTKNKSWEEAAFGFAAEAMFHDYSPACKTCLNDKAVADKGTCACVQQTVPNLRDNLIRIYLAENLECFTKLGDRHLNPFKHRTCKNGASWVSIAASEWNQGIGNTSINEYGNKVRTIYDRLRKDRKCGDEPALNCPPRKN